MGTKFACFDSCVIAQEGKLLIQEMLGAMSWYTFATDYFKRAPYAAPYAARRFKGIVGWASIADILEKHDDCWLPKRGKFSAQLTGKITFAYALSQFNLGHTILVRHAECACDDFRKIAFEFHNFFNAPVDIQLYITPAGEQGFDWHYDVEDVFVIQTKGEKEFTLLPNTVTQKPLPMMSANNYFIHENRKSVIKCLLKPGDWLYIPAGYWHKARAISDSFHFSIGIM